MDDHTDERVTIRARVTVAVKAAIERSAERNDRSQVAEAGKWLEHYAEDYLQLDGGDDG